MTSGTPEDWAPLSLPLDQTAADILRSWLAGQHETLNGTYEDFRGADLSGGRFLEAWLSGANLSGTNLARCNLLRGHFEEADLSGAILAGSDLTKANFDDAKLIGSNLSGTDLRDSSMVGTLANGANFSGAHMGGAMFVEADLRGASLAAATAYDTVLDAVLDRETNVSALRGTVFGPCRIETRGALIEIDGPDMQSWFNSRGAEVTVTPPRNPRARQYTLQNQPPATTANPVDPQHLFLPDPATTDPNHRGW